MSPELIKLTRFRILAQRTFSERIVELTRKLPTENNRYKQRDIEDNIVLNELLLELLGEVRVPKNWDEHSQAFLS